MPEYTYVYESFDIDEAIDIPADAVGITVDSTADFVTVRYLVPKEDSDE